MSAGSPIREPETETGLNTGSTTNQALCDSSHQRSVHRLLESVILCYEQRLTGGEGWGYSTSTELNHIVHVVLISALDVQSCT